MVVPVVMRIVMTVVVVMRMVVRIHGKPEGDRTIVLKAVKRTLKVNSERAWYTAGRVFPEVDQSYWRSEPHREMRGTLL